MKKMVKKLTAVLIAATMVFALVMCTSAAETGKHCKIGVVFYQDTGLEHDATIAYLDSLSEGLNVEFIYTTSGIDDAAVMTTIQTLIAAGADGIISTMGAPGDAISECEAAGVYLGGFLSDCDTAYVTMYDKVFKSPNFVGTIADGHTPDDINIGLDMFASLLEYNERNADDPVTHVSMAIFPEFAYPTQAMAADQFVNAIEEYNATADVQITVDPLNPETDILMFTAVDSTYFAKHEGIDGMISFAAGGAFVYPTMVSAGVENDIKLFTTGFDGGEENNFGSNGTKTYQQLTATAPETIVFPLVLLLNKINGVDFVDQPEVAERLSGELYLINSDEDVAKVQTSLYYTKDPANAVYTAEDILAMTAFANPEATYANLVEKTTQLTVESIK